MTEVFFMEYISEVTRHLPGVGRYIPQLGNVFGLEPKKPPAPPPKSLVSCVKPELSSLEMSIVRLAGVSGALAVGLGAYGAHGEVPSTFLLLLL